jgi:molecular chaperone DnaK
MNCQVLGIDFGTTNSTISILKNNNPELILNNNNYLIPSKIFISDNKYYCGNEIPIKKNGFLIKNFKTKIGSNYYYNYNDNKYHINDLLFIYIKYLKKIINLEDNNKTVISVPANFSNDQRNILKNIFSELKFNIIRIINEPTSAAISYGLTDKCEEEDKILVFDIGGGTLDITILEKDELFFEIIESVGNKFIGGKDFTNVIFKDIKSKYDLSEYNNNELDILWNTCNTSKEMLFYQENQIIRYKDIEYELSTDKLCSLSKNIINKIKKLINSIENKIINQIILVGGSSKLKIINDIITNTFKTNINSYENLQTVVSLGNCLYSGILSENIKNNNLVIIDCLQLSIGIETNDGNFSIIIPKNTPLPAIKKKKYRLIEKEEDFILKIYQGEKKLACKNRFLYEIDLQKYYKNINNLNKIIEITFKIDLNSIININITDETNNINEKIYNKLKKIDQNKINEILEEAIHNFDKESEEYKIREYTFIIEKKIIKLLDNISKNKNILKNIKNEIINELIIIRKELYNYDLQKLLKIKNKIFNILPKII